MCSYDDKCEMVTFNHCRDLMVIYILYEPYKLLNINIWTSQSVHLRARERKSSFHPLAYPWSRGLFLEIPCCYCPKRITSWLWQPHWLFRHPQLTILRFQGPYFHQGLLYVVDFSQKEKTVYEWLDENWVFDGLMLYTKSIN